MRTKMIVKKLMRKDDSLMSDSEVEYTFHYLKYLIQNITFSLLAAAISDFRGQDDVRTSN